MFKKKNKQNKDVDQVSDAPSSIDKGKEAIKQLPERLSSSSSKKDTKNSVKFDDDNSAAIPEDQDNEINEERDNELQSKIEAHEEILEEKDDEIMDLKIQIKEQSIDIKLQNAQSEDYALQMKQKDEDLLVLENQVEESKNRYETQINELKIKCAKIDKEQTKIQLDCQVQCDDGEIFDAMVCLPGASDADNKALLDDQNLLDNKNTQIEELKQKIARMKARLPKPKIELDSNSVVLQITCDGNNSQKLARKEDIAKLKQKVQVKPPSSVLTEESQLRRSKSVKVFYSKEDYITELRATLQEQVEIQNVEMDQISQCHQNKVAALKNDMIYYQNQMPESKYKYSKRFEILPGYAVDNNFQYPDMLNLVHKPFEELQPMQFGIHQLSMVSQFGDVDQLRIGQTNDKKACDYQVSLDQTKRAQRVSKIEFNWKKYESDENVLIFYRFKYYNSKNTLIGQMQNFTDREFQKLVATQRYRFVEKKSDYCFLLKDEVIAGIAVGLRKSQSVVKVQFILSKI